MDDWPPTQVRGYGRRMSAATSLFVADAEPETYRLLTRQLPQDGFRLVGATGSPDLVLAGDVASVAHWAEHVPVIVLGREQADSVDRIRAFRHGCDDYLVSRRSTTRSSSSAFGRCSGACGRRRLRSSRRPGPHRHEDTRRARPGVSSSALAEGIRAPAAARPGARPGLHEGGAAPGRLGVPGDGADADARLPRVTAAAKAPGGRRRPRAGRQRLGGGLSTARNRVG